MIERLKGAYRKLPPIGKYLLFSVLVTLVDAALSWLLSMRLEVRLPVANTIGVVVGQVIHYALSSGQVFNMEYGGVGAVIYFSTFLLGLVAANAIITAVWPWPWCPRTWPFWQPRAAPSWCLFSACTFCANSSITW